jgi:hypothetical protein
MYQYRFYCMYRSLCRSKLEACSQFWSPQTKCNVLSVESVQRKMTKYITNYADLSYTDRCFVLKILPLSFRREIADLTYLYKCIHHIIDVDFTDVLTFSSPTQTRSSDVNILKVQRTRTEAFKLSYFNRAVFLWNHLPFEIRCCTSLATFKSKLADFYSVKLRSYDVSNTCTVLTTSHTFACFVCNKAYFILISSASISHLQSSSDLMIPAPLESIVFSESRFFFLVDFRKTINLLSTFCAYRCDTFTASSKRK